MGRCNRTTSERERRTTTFGTPDANQKVIEEERRTWEETLEPMYPLCGPLSGCRRERLLEEDRRRIDGVNEEQIEADVRHVETPWTQLRINRTPNDANKKIDAGVYEPSSTA
jgi:hypothetical protein